MEREYNVGTWLTPSDEYIQDIKQTLVEKGVATELTPNEELSGIVENITTLKGLLDITKKADNLFYNLQSIEDLSNVISYDDTENVTNFSGMFKSCKKLKTIPNINTKNGTTFYEIFNGCSSIKTIPQLDTSNVGSFSYAFYNCTSLENVPDLDTKKSYQFNRMFMNCSKIESITFLDTSSMSDDYGSNSGNPSEMFSGCTSLKTIKTLDLWGIVRGSTSNMLKGCSSLENLEIINIRYSLTIGSGTSYGHLLTIDSLINACKECINRGTSYTLTVGTANLAKLADVYVKFVDTTQTTIATKTKGEVEVCESTDEGAMTITEYMALKNWTLA